MRTSSYNREPAAALSSTKLRSVINAIQRMRNKQVLLARQRFALPELMDLFVEPQHHAALRYVYDLVEPTGTVCQLYVEAEIPAHLQRFSEAPAYMKFSWYGTQQGGFHVPRNAGADDSRPARILREHTRPETVEKYVQVEQDLLDIQCRFAVVEMVLCQLNEVRVCKTLPQIRYVWPCITILLAKADLKDDAAAVAEPSARAGAQVVVPEKTAALLKESNDTIVRAMMLDGVEPVDANQGGPSSYQLIDKFRTS